MIRIGVNVMDTNCLDNDLLLPEIDYGRRKVGHPSREDDYDYDNGINKILPAAQIMGICYALAASFLEMQGESVLDDYNW